MSHVNHFDDLASTWDDDPRRIARAAAVAAEIGRRLRLEAGTAILEVGAGTGAIGRTLAPQVAQVTLLDSSAKMTEVARQRIQQTGLRQVRAICGELSDLRGERFDVIIASLALHHMPDVPAALSQFAGLLRVGGQVAIADLDEDIEHEYHDEGFGGHHGFNRDHLSADLRQAGFDGLEWTTVFQMPKTTRSGQEKVFPVFLVTATLSG